jgi:hypothetical protein
MMGILVVVGFVFLAGLMVAAVIFASQKEKQRREQVLLAAGFQACESQIEKQDMGRRLQFFNPRHGGKRLVMGLYRKNLEDPSSVAYFCKYHFAGAGGRTSGGEWNLVILSGPGLNLPQLLLERIPSPTGAMGRLYKAMASGFPPGKLLRRNSDDPGLSIFVDPDCLDFEVVDALAQALSATANGLDLQASGDLLVLSEPMGPGPRALDGARLQRQVQVLRKLYQVASKARR